VGVLNSALGAYYYLRVTVSMFMVESVEYGQPVLADKAGEAGRSKGPEIGHGQGQGPERARAETPKTGWPVMATIVLAALGTVILGLWQWPWIQNITQAVSTLALR
jgi:NADH:ubiquinone oxidoreductase subunit 2 (subunit N)